MDRTDAPYDYRSSDLYQRMLEDCDLRELPSGDVVPAEHIGFFRRLVSVLHLATADCFQERLAAIRPLQEIQALVQRVREQMFRGGSRQELSPSLVADGAELEQLVITARGRANPRFSLQRIAADA